MDALVLVISVLSLLTNLFLVRHFTKGRVLLTATLEEFTDLPLPESAWQDAADEVLIEEQSEPIPAAAPAGDTSAWKNQTGIQQGDISATPAPPIAKPTAAPLERPYGFVRQWYND